MVPSGEPSRQTMWAMSAPLARIRSTYCASHMITLVSALSNRYTNCSAGSVLYTENADGADVLGADLERIELRAVGHHQRHRVAAL